MGRCRTAVWDSDSGPGGLYFTAMDIAEVGGKRDRHGGATSSGPVKMIESATDLAVVLGVCAVAAMEIYWLTRRSG
jgi:hypothetical protein